MKLKDITRDSTLKENGPALLNLHRHLHGLYAQGDVDKRLLEEKHEVVSDAMRQRGMIHNVGDELDERATKVRGIYLSPPHGELIWQGKKKALAKSRKYDLEGETFELCSDGYSYGYVRFGPAQKVGAAEFDRPKWFEKHRVTAKEHQNWWPDAEYLWVYDVADFQKFDDPKGIKLKPGTQTFITEVEYKAVSTRALLERLKGETFPDTVLVPDFLWLVGGAVEHPDKAADVDVLFRAEEGDGQFSIDALSAMTAVRDAIAPDKGMKLDYWWHAQGPHQGKALPLADLVLRWKEQREEREVKAAKSLSLRLVGTGAMGSPRRGSTLLIEYSGQRVQIDGEKGGDIQENLDALLITDREAWNAEAAKRSGGKVAKYEKDGLTVTPRKVVHTSHDVYGYLIEADGHKAAYVPELWKWPAWARDLDVAIVDGSAWDRDIAFAEETGGHRALASLVKSAGKYNIGRVIATHIGKPTDEALEAGEKLEGLEIAEDGQKIRLGVGEKAIGPGRRYQVMKPRMKGYTEFFDTAELWEKWAAEKLEQGHELLGSPKIDGFRAVISWDGKAVSVWFEDSQETKTPPGMPELKGPPFVIEGEFTAKRGGDWLARTQLAGVAAGKEDAAPHFWLYDLLYHDGQDWSEKPFSERLAVLKKLDLPSAFTVLEQRRVKDKADLGKIGKWAASQPLSEGLFIRQADVPYVFGPTDTAAKVKTVAELKVEVLEPVKRENGIVYHVALREPGDFTNTIEMDGKPLLDLGNTFVGPDQRVKRGDTLNVICEELVAGSKDGKPILFWGKPTVKGPDKSRSAYTVTQAIDLARRGHIYKEEVTATKAALREEPTRAEASAKFWAENWWKMVPKSGRGQFTYQHHFRGLSEEESKLDEPALLETDHSVHGDLRLTAQTGDLWGFSIFLGTTADVRKADGCRLCNLPPDDNLQGSWKLEEPKEWLGVARRKPYVSEPEEAGATSKKYAKFFEVAHGVYRLGVCRNHLFELFLKGDKLSGRYLIEYAPIGGRRIWIVDKPKDETPYAESHKLEDVLAELKRKGQEHLVWSDGQSKPVLYDVATGEPMRTKTKKEPTPEELEEMETNLWANILQSGTKRWVTIRGKPVFIESPMSKKIRGAVHRTLTDQLGYGKTTGAEAAAWIDEDGKVLAKQYSKQDAIKQPSVSETAGAVAITHNHPANLTFSDADVEALFRTNVKHMIVVTPDGTVYRLSKTERANAQNFFSGLIGNEVASLASERGVDPIKDFRAYASLRDEVVRQVAKDAGLSYVTETLEDYEIGKRSVVPKTTKAVVTVLERVEVEPGVFRHVVGVPFQRES